MVALFKIISVQSAAGDKPSTSSNYNLGNHGGYQFAHNEPGRGIDEKEPEFPSPEGPRFQPKKQLQLQHS